MSAMRYHHELDHELAEPQPKPCPHYISSWRHQLLFQEHQELTDTFVMKWQACWKDGVLVGALPFDGARFEELLKKAAEHHHYDELDRCERVLAEAELLMLGQPVECGEACHV